MTEQTQPHAPEADPQSLVDTIPEPELKWSALNLLERAITALCGALLAGFTIAVLLDVVTRAAGSPVAGLQNFVLGAFVWGIFLGAAVAQRRREHFRLAALAEHYSGLKRQLFETLENVVVIAIAAWMFWFGLQNLKTGMHNYLQPSEVPLAAVTAAIPAGGALIGLFCIERLYHVWTHGSDLGRPQDIHDIDMVDQEVGRGE
jgi:TRAP-type C4-dicarboxylate transport system permease small subunit